MTERSPRGVCVECVVTVVVCVLCVCEAAGCESRPCLGVNLFMRERTAQSRVMQATSCVRAAMSLHSVHRYKNSPANSGRDTVLSLTRKIMPPRKAARLLRRSTGRRARYFFLGGAASAASLGGSPLA